MADNFKINVEVGANMTEFERKIRQSASMMSSVFNAKTGLTTQKFDLGNIEKAGQKYKQFGTIVTDVNGKVVNSINTLKPAADGAASAFAKIDLAGLVSRALITIPVWAAMRAGMQAVTATIEHSIQFIIEWETVMARLQVVSGGTAEQMKAISSSILEVGAAFGMSSKDVGEAATMWVQQGKSIGELKPLLESTAQLSIITGRSVKESVEDITSIMKNYGMAAQETGRIIDTLTAIDMQHAITTTDLIAAYKEAAPVASMVGISFEKLGGIITATHVATRASGSRIGHELTTVFTRLGTVAIDTMQNIAGIPMYLDAAGNATTENTGRLRNIGEVLDELAAKWNTYGDALQNQIARGVAGTRQANLFVSSMQQWEEGIQATIDALNSFGAGQRATDIMMNTIAKRTEQVVAAWNLFVDSLSKTQVPKDALEWLANKLTDIANTIEAIGQIEVPDWLKGIVSGAVTVAKEAAKIAIGPAIEVGQAAHGTAKSLVPDSYKQAKEQEKSDAESIKNASDKVTQYKLLNGAVSETIKQMSVLKRLEEDNKGGNLDKQIAAKRKEISELEKVTGKNLSATEWDMLVGKDREETAKNILDYTEKTAIALQSQTQQATEIASIQKQQITASPDEYMKLQAQKAKAASPERLAEITSGIKSERDTKKAEAGDLQLQAALNDYQERSREIIESSKNARADELSIIEQQLALLNQMTGTGAGKIPEDEATKIKDKLAARKSKIEAQNEENQLQRELNELEAQGEAQGKSKLEIEQAKLELMKSQGVEGEKLLDQESKIKVEKLAQIKDTTEQAKKMSSSLQDKIKSSLNETNEDINKYSDTMKKIQESQASHAEKIQEINANANKSIEEIEKDYRERNVKKSDYRKKEDAIAKVEQQKEEALKAEQKRYEKEQKQLEAQKAEHQEDVQIATAQLDYLRNIAESLSAQSGVSTNTNPTQVSSTEKIQDFVGKGTNFKSIDQSPTSFTADKFGNPKNLKSSIIDKAQEDLKRQQNYMNKYTTPTNIDKSSAAYREPSSSTANKNMESPKQATGEVKPALNINVNLGGISVTGKTAEEVFKAVGDKVKTSLQSDKTIKEAFAAYTFREHQE